MRHRGKMKQLEPEKQELWEQLHLGEMMDTDGMLTEELGGLQLRLGQQEKIQEALIDLELEKQRRLAKLRCGQTWTRAELGDRGSGVTGPEAAGSPEAESCHARAELKILKCQPNSAEPSFPFCSEEADTLRLKVKELEGEQSRLV
ncbi:Mitotic spindle assembly checkpoint protein MAD1 [Fukomys damarensis]|uniref:Mitotic spindle assembly checkpoint protein MAD1 n=1 Tax=Fukomys damarensis TaxID=885580 RepID=A0A091CVY4_FUKDA|nr:Mitotic spindle assembly checkpoint protein MAD1 [Fukomys damarensis]